MNPLAYVMMGQLELDGVREWMKDFWAFGVTAVQRIAGQLAHTAEDGRTFKAVAQAFSTLTRFSRLLGAAQNGMVSLLVRRADADLYISLDLRSGRPAGATNTPLRT